MNNPGFKKYMEAIEDIEEAMESNIKSIVNKG